MPIFLAQAVVDDDGNASVDITHNVANFVWEVQQISVVTSQVTSSATAYVMQDGNLVAPSAALTPLRTGQGATAAGLPYIYLFASNHCDIFVQGAEPGDTLTLRAQYREFFLTAPEVQGY